jgi:hypothetical protein
MVYLTMMSVSMLYEYSVDVRNYKETKRVRKGIKDGKKGRE